MSSIHETAYPRLKSEFSKKELQDVYTPTVKEYWLANTIKKPIPRLGFLLHLKLFQRLGYFIPLNQTPDDIIKHIVAHSQMRQKPSKKQLLDYDQSGSKTRHIKIIRQHLGVKVLSEKDRLWLATTAETAAETKEVLQDVINVMLEELVHHSFELPGYSVLQRIARKARNDINERCYKAITGNLTNEARQQIDELLSDRSSDSYSAWHTLKREPKKPTNKEVRSYIQHVNWLQTLGSSMPEVSLPVDKLKQLTYEARALNAREITELKHSKRYAIAVILIRSQHSKCLDDIAELFIRIIRKMEGTAKTQLKDYLLEHQKQVDELVRCLKDVLSAYQKASTNKAKLSSIETVIGDKADLLINQCDRHLAYEGSNHLPFLLQNYHNRRAILFNCLEIMDLRSTSNDKTTEQIIVLLKALRNNRQQTITTDYIESIIAGKFDIQWMPENWRKQVFSNEKDESGSAIIHRKYLELCILTHIKQELSGTDLHIPYSDEFRDYREQLANDDVLAEQMELYGDLVDLPVNDPRVFTKHLKQSLAEVSRAVDKSFPSNLFADIQDGRLILRKQKRSVPSEDIEMLDKLLTENLPQVSIIDILTDTEKWLGLHKNFSPLSGNDKRIDQPEKRFIMTLFCYGCNFGPTQTARSIKGFTRRQVAWLNLKHATEDRLVKTINQVTNAYNKFDLPKYWGKGQSASADGTLWDLYEQNILSEHHIRYGRYGGIGYYHVSDNYIAFFSHFITCGAYEGSYILDGITNNQSDIQPDTLHGDTHAQSYTIFGLSYLLGINLMPRIRKMNDMRLYRPDKRYRYENIDSLFSGNIDYKLIETHLPDMMRVVVSIKLGIISPSTILKRLSSYSRKNKLYFAFRELGKVVRTIFLLKYINEIELRQTINAATCKSEEFNNFAKWLFFGGDGVISENLRHEQRKIIKYNHLVANMVVLHNAENMTKVLKQLRAEGVKITPEMLAGINPYRIGQINRFGDYIVDTERDVPPLDFNIKILDTESEEDL